MVLVVTSSVKFCNCHHIVMHASLCTLGWLQKQAIFLSPLRIFCYEALTSLSFVFALNLAWRRHQIETFSVLLAIWEGNPPVIGGFPSQRPVTRSFDVFFVVRLNKWLSKQSRCWWFETSWRSVWRQSNGKPPTVRHTKIIATMGYHLLNISGIFYFETMDDI